MYHIVEVYFPELGEGESYSKCFVKFRTTKQHELYEEIHVKGIRDNKDYKGFVVNVMWVDQLPEHLAKTIL